MTPTQTPDVHQIEALLAQTPAEAELPGAWNEVLQAVPAAQRQRLLKRLAVRLEAPEGVSGGDAGTAGAGDGGSSAAAREKLGRLEREVRELRAELEDARTTLTKQGAEFTAAQKELEERANAQRALQRQAGEERERMLQLEEAERRQADNVRRLQQELAKSDQERQREAARAVRLDSELRRLKQAGAAMPSVPPPGDEQAAEAGATAAPPAPVAPAPLPVTSGELLWDTLCEQLCAAGLLGSEDVVPVSEERLQRVAAVLAALVRFQSDVEKVVMAQLEELKRRHTSLSEHYDVLRYYQRNERVWWWGLTEPAGRQVVPERQYAAYLSHLSKMVFALLTAYLRTLSYDVSQQSRLLLDPGAVRRAAQATRKDALWDYYETRGWSAIPRRLSDACQEAFAGLVDKIYHYGAGSV